MIQHCHYSRKRVDEDQTERCKRKKVPQVPADLARRFHFLLYTRINKTVSCLRNLSFSWTRSLSKQTLKNCFFVDKLQQEKRFRSRPSLTTKPIRLGETFLKFPSIIEKKPFWNHFVHLVGILYGDRRYLSLQYINT